MFLMLHILVKKTNIASYVLLSCVSRPAVDLEHTIQPGSGHTWQRLGSLLRHTHTHTLITCIIPYLLFLTVDIITMLVVDIFLYIFLVKHNS